ncbi:MAG: helix-hairpin-helix domain-containing protein [Lachnospiraceae bacterium]|nr:helix-hairpin-helix domain-containing protein [Lachnospiraceae bacterium]
MKKKFSLIILIALIIPIMACGMSEEATFYEEEIENTEEETVSEPVENEEEELIYVSILGCVQNPGVYILKKGTRMYEAINEAGGVIDDGDVSSINLVDIIKDGTQIVIKPASAENGSETPGIGADGKVNINAADSNVLVTIPGIGPSRAKDIISYREKNGGFQKIEDIMNIPGIKEKTFESIKDSITVY